MWYGKCVCVWLWRSEIDIRCRSCYPPHHYVCMQLGIGSLTSFLKLTDCTRLAGQGASGFLLLPLPKLKLQEQQVLYQLSHLSSSWSCSLVREINYGKGRLGLASWSPHEQMNMA